MNIKLPNDKLIKVASVFRKLGPSIRILKTRDLFETQAIMHKITRTRPAFRRLKAFTKKKGKIIMSEYDAAFRELMSGRSIAGTLAPCTNPLAR